MTVRELLRAHDLKTQDEADELLVKLAMERDMLLAELKHLRWTVGAVERLMGAAIEKAEAK